MTEQEETLIVEGRMLPVEMHRSGETAATPEVQNAFRHVTHGGEEYPAAHVRVHLLRLPNSVSVSVV